MLSMLGKQYFPGDYESEEFEDMLLEMQSEAFAS